jgi:hypothetical protein
MSTTIHPPSENAEDTEHAAGAGRTGEEKRSSVVDALFDVAYAWTEVGLVRAKVALETTARAMQKTADALETIKGSLRREA